MNDDFWITLGKAFVVIIALLSMGMLGFTLGMYYQEGREKKHRRKK